MEAILELLFVIVVFVRSDYESTQTARSKKLAQPCSYGVHRPLVSLVFGLFGLRRFCLESVEVHQPKQGTSFVIKNSAG